MLIREIMTKDVITVTMDDSVDQVAKILVENRIHAVPVLVGNKPVGIITETDFFTKGSVKIYLPGYIEFIKKDNLSGSASKNEKDKMELLANTKAGDIMSEPCVTIGQDDDVNVFLDLVKGGKYISVPVVDGERKLAGIITLSDVISFIKIDI